MITLHAYAKINLGLRIIGTLPDGYHAIHSLFLPIHDLFDILSFELHDTDIVFRSNDTLNIAPENNLIVKAAHMLRSHFGIHKGAIISLDKIIPSGAGLGGGSSDAASTFMGLIRLWNIQTDIKTIADLALSLGSDIPFFLHDTPAIVEGRGEIIQPISCHIQAWILFIFPGIHVNTGWAYSTINSYSNPNEVDIKNALRNGVIDFHSHELTNDFESSIFKEYPLLQDIKSKLLESGADIALMSGSGSTIYGIFSDHQLAKKAEKHIAMQSTLLIPLRLGDTSNKEEVS